MLIKSNNLNKKKKMNVIKISKKERKKYKKKKEFQFIRKKRQSLFQNKIVKQTNQQKKYSMYNKIRRIVVF